VADPKLALIIQCLSLFFFYILHTLSDVFAYPRLKTSDLEEGTASIFRVEKLNVYAKKIQNIFFTL
jgi:hypothetical protein